jgi:hypothetical protein
MSSPNVVRTAEPFERPRIVISDLACASKLFQYGLQQLSHFKDHSSPILIIQPVMELTGGLSEIENRALLELGGSAGARKTFIHCGEILSDQEVVALGQGLVEYRWYSDSLDVRRALRCRIGKSSFDEDDGALVALRCLGEIAIRGH